LPSRPPEDAPPAGVALLALDEPAIAALVERGVEPAQLYRALAHRPALLDAWLAFAGAVRADCTLPRALRELVILRSAQLSGGRYIWSDHVPMALAAGVSLERLQALADRRRSDVLTCAEHAALEVAEQLALHADASDASLAVLGEHFGPGEQVELALTAGFYAMVPRVLAALRVPLPDRSPGPVPFPDDD
jgi:4-carboxymuconolactone decarboxylase